MDFQVGVGFPFLEDGIDEPPTGLHRIAPGSTDRSYGIHVAKIAGMPRSVVDRAHELLGQLEVSHDKVEWGGQQQPQADEQLSLFTPYLEHPALESLRQLDLDGMTPMESFDALRRLQNETNGNPTTSED